jgi:CRP-like cAMP-binding protein
MTIDLKTIALFSQLDDELMDSLQAALKPRSLAAGEVLFNQGDPGDALFVVDEGQVAIFMPETPGKAEGQAIRIFQAGQVLGEMALIDQKPRSASARAETDSKVLLLDKDSFHRLVAGSPALSLSVMAGLSDRIRYTTDFLGEVTQWVRKMADGNYLPEGVEQGTQARDATLSVLAAEFARMAGQVKVREESLRMEVAMLRVEIDEKRRKEEVQEIMKTDYYQDLKAKIKAMRAEKE